MSRSNCSIPSVPRNYFLETALCTVGGDCISTASRVKKKKTNEKRRRKEGNRWRSWPHPLCRYFGILQTPGLPEDSRAPPNTRNNPADCTSPKTVCLLSYTCGRSVRRWYPGSHVPPARVVADRKMCSVNQTSWLSLCCAGIARQELPFAFFFGARQFRNNA